MTRLIDLFAVLVVAVVVLLPEPSIDAYAAVQADKADLDRISLLQDALYRQPGDVTTAVELGRAYLAVDHPEWALATLHAFGGAQRGAAPSIDKSGNYQVHQVSAYAYATLLLPQAALGEAEAGLHDCEAAAATCGDVSRIRLSYLADMMRKLVAAGVDPKKDPMAAKRLVSEALHSTRSPTPEPDELAPVKAPAPSKSGGTSPAPGGAHP